MKLLPLEGKENSNLYRHPKTGIIYLKMYREGKGQLERSTKTITAKELRKISKNSSRSSLRGKSET